MLRIIFTGCHLDVIKLQLSLVAKIWVLCGLENVNASQQTERLHQDLEADEAENQANTFVPES